MRGPGRGRARLGFTGACDAGPDARGFSCNDKLIGARYYVAGFGADRLGPNDFLSPRDGHGHGSHTASTSAGRSGVSGVSGGRDFGDISGIAPGARIASYKVCWEGKPGVSATGCFDSDAVAAINDAVADGVDVINFSISGTTASYTDPVEIAFLNAAVAGVFVAASAGNSGPAESTVDHPSPWLTTVAASTHTVNESTVELGDGERLIGASLTTGLDQPTPSALGHHPGRRRDGGAGPAVPARLARPGRRRRARSSSVTAARTRAPRSPASWLTPAGSA